MLTPEEIVTRYADLQPGGTSAERVEVEGTVIRVTDFGKFLRVDLGPVQALVRPLTATEVGRLFTAFGKVIRTQKGILCVDAR